LFSVGLNVYSSESESDDDERRNKSSGSESDTDDEDRLQESIQRKKEQFEKKMHLLEEAERGLLAM
jgi:hypothetical protein